MKITIKTTINYIDVGARFAPELENYPYIGNNDENDQVWVLLKMALHGS